VKKSFLFLLGVTGLMAPLAADQVVSTAPGAPIGQISYHYDDCCEHHFDPCCAHECCDFWHGGNSQWGGFYVGALIGYGFGEGTDLTDFDVFPKLKPRGWLGGGEIGWNYQFCNWVVGIEADIVATDIRESVFFSEEATRYLGTVRARLGYDWCDNLIYLTGGFAYGRTKYAALNNNIASTTKTRTGWTIGAGFERMFGCHWSAKVEYLYYQLHKFNADYNFDGPLRINWKTTAHTVRLGVNYHF
jgi:outer membrane immunogenic protein